RLPDGPVLLLHREGTDCNDPDRLQYPRSKLTDYAGGLALTFYGSQFVTRVELGKNYDIDGALTFSSMRVRELVSGRSTWSWQVYRHSNEKIVDDRRSGEKAETEVALTPVDWEQLTIPRPAFGQFEGLVQIVRDLLRSEGYGEMA